MDMRDARDLSAQLACSCSCFWFPVKYGIILINRKADQIFRSAASTEEEPVAKSLAAAASSLWAEQSRAAAAEQKESPRSEYKYTAEFRSN